MKLLNLSHDDLLELKLMSEFLEKEIYYGKRRAENVVR